MWHDKRTDVVLAEKKIGDQIKEAATALVAVMRLKWVMGARKYHKNPDIEKIFSKQKWRIGEVLEKIEQAFIATQRPATGGQVYRPWVRIDLRQRWDDYMNDRFEKAYTRTQNTMDRSIAKLENLYVTPFKGKPQPVDPSPEYDRMTTIKALASEWRREKRSRWIAPWIRRPVQPDGTVGAPVVDQLDGPSGLDLPRRTL